jgi:haloalkane dehalogenase
MANPLDGDFDGTFPFEAHYVDAAGTRLHYVDEGVGAPVLLLHGNPTWSYMWREPIRRLSAAGRRCVAPDHMGFGRSDKPPEPRRYRLRTHIDNLLALIDELDLRDIALVMHDWGGPIGMGAAVERPDRIRAVVAMNTWAWQIPSFLPPFLRQFRTDGLGELLALGGNLVVESIPGGMVRRDTDPVMMDAYRAPFPDYWSRIGPLAFQRDIPLTENDPSAETIGAVQERLTDLSVPMLLLWGMRDPVFRPVFLDQWKELFPAAEVIELEEASHYLVEDDPVAVSDALERFLG